MIVIIKVPEPENFGNYLLKSEGFSEIILPSTISLLPQTTGAKVALCLIVVTILFSIFIAIKKWRKNQYRRAAVKQIKSKTFKENHLNSILKSVAVHAYPHSPKGPLVDESWLCFLNSKIPSRKSIFTLEMIKLMERNQYAKPAESSTFGALEQQCKHAAIDWVRQHKEEVLK